MMTFTLSTSRWAVGAALAALAISLGTSPLAEPILEITVRPTVTTAPGFVHIVARVEPHEDNRTLIIQAESAQFYRASYVQLDGEYAARTHPMLLKNLPAGVYKITVTVRGREDLRAVSRGLAEVVG